MINPRLDQWLMDFLAEDLGSGDITSMALLDSEGRRGFFSSRKGGVVAGLPFAQRLYQLLGVENWQSHYPEGAKVPAGTVIAEVKGPGHLLLQGERVALNVLQRLGGIATATRQMADLAGSHTRVIDTRKTTPGFRWFEKYAVRTGGGYNHRWGLYDAVMLKDNHIKLAGGIGLAVARVKASLGHTAKIEVEAEALPQVQEALSAGADIIMLDNMSPAQVAEAVQLVAGKAITEASGNIGPHNLADYVATRVDYISMGFLTHSVKALDIGFDLDQPKEDSGNEKF
jgi:nicotinate-nucleotide pyrophosphorylase (carboxylating)